MTPLRARDLAAGGLFTVLGLSLWLYAATFPSLPEGHPGPALFPRLVAAGLFLSGLALAVRSLRRRAPADEAPAPQRLHTAGLVRLLFGVGLVALYPLVQNGLGFIPALSLLGFGIACMLRVRLVVAAATALAAAGLLYWTFTGLLGVPL